MSIERLFLAYMETGFYSVIAGLCLLLLWMLLSRLTISKSLCTLAMAALLLRLLLPVNIPAPFSLFQIKALDDMVPKAEDFSRSFSGNVKIALDIPGGNGEFERVTAAGVPALEPDEWSRHPEQFPYRAAFYYENEDGSVSPART